MRVKRLKNVLNAPLVSGKAFLYITGLFPEPENILHPTATSKEAWIIGILGDGNSVNVEGTHSKEGMRENTEMETKIRD